MTADPVVSVELPAQTALAHSESRGADGSMGEPGGPRSQLADPQALTQRVALRRFVRVSVRIPVDPARQLDVELPLAVPVGSLATSLATSFPELVDDMLPPAWTLAPTGGVAIEPMTELRASDVVDGQILELVAVCADIGEPLPLRVEEIIEQEQALEAARTSISAGLATFTAPIAAVLVTAMLVLAATTVPLTSTTRMIQSLLAVLASLGLVAVAASGRSDARGATTACALCVPVTLGCAGWWLALPASGVGRVGIAVMLGGVMAFAASRSALVLGIAVAAALLGVPTVLLSLSGGDQAQCAAVVATWSAAVTMFGSAFALRVSLADSALMIVPLPAESVRVQELPAALADDELARRRSVVEAASRLEYVRLAFSALIAVVVVGSAISAGLSGSHFAAGAALCAAFALGSRVAFAGSAVEGAVLVLGMELGVAALAVVVPANGRLAWVGPLGAMASVAVMLATALRIANHQRIDALLSSPKEPALLAKPSAQRALSALLLCGALLATLGTYGVFGSMMDMGRHF